MSPNLDKMLELLRSNESTEVMVAELRENFLDIDAVSKECGHDILPEVCACPKHVVLYTAMYIEMLKNQND